MPYEVDVNQYLGLTVCTLWGLVWVEERQAALDEVIAEMEEGRPYRILVDMIGASCANDSFATSSAFAQRLATERKLKGCRIAYLYPDNARINLSVERLAEARDFKFRRFTTTTEALDWLLSPPTRIKSAPAIGPQSQPDAVTLLAGLRSGRWVA
ncbi:hypothetical protein LF41_2529 [Lysobacter dokdonensis DS-58]|uniref:STAS/SEC14 domain-containing protein n=1 Tax=Lysobacter dokdonensis DS-58 TaxID=1300345 RepID=A0A0A2WHB6_9GAMM|nr:hypothetical protein [Lysobacter dokdonensis]KGQ19591.1 hypothetical protein LF41_2529 [Lysobacter dokdonensis DS-58]